MAAVRDHGRPRVDHLSRLGAPTALGLDETSFLKANRFHATLLITGFVDLDRSRLVDVVAGHSAAAVSDWLDTKPALRELERSGGRGHPWLKARDPPESVLSKTTEAGGSLWNMTLDACAS